MIFNELDKSTLSAKLAWSLLIKWLDHVVWMPREEWGRYGTPDEKAAFIFENIDDV